MLTTSKCTSAKCYLFLKIHLLPCGGVGWGEKNLCPNYFPRVSGHNLFFNIADAFKNSWILLLSHYSGNSLVFPLWTVQSLACNESLISFFFPSLYSFYLLFCCASKDIHTHTHVIYNRGDGNRYPCFIFLLGGNFLIFHCNVYYLV